MCVQFRGGVGVGVGWDGLGLGLTLTLTLCCPLEDEKDIRIMHSGDFYVVLSRMKRTSEPCIFGDFYVVRWRMTTSEPCILAIFMLFFRG